MDQTIAEYLEWKHSYAPIASKAYSCCLKKLNNFLNKRIDEMTQIDIARFIENQSILLKPRTIVWYTNILKDFFHYNRTQVNPKLIRHPKFTGAPQEYLTEEEFKQMDAVLNEYEYFDLQKKVVLNILWYTGVRVSELCDMNLLDIENTRNMARIITKKNKRYRWIMWHDDAHKLLMRYIGSKLCIDEHPALFTSHYRHHSGRITTRTIERWVSQIAKRAGIEKHVHPHVIRHGKAHFILSNGGELFDAKEILGHISIVSTQMYTGLFPDEFRKRAERFL